MILMGKPISTQKKPSSVNLRAFEKRYVISI
jgi:poly-beta-hydroxyalkanoate depolymerase